MAYTDEELLKLDPELEKAFKKYGIPKLPIPTRETLPALRKRYSMNITRFNDSPLAKTIFGETPKWTENDHKCPVRDGSAISVRVYSPQNPSVRGCPMAVVIHGGGWLMGDLDTEAFVCRLLCAKLGMVVFNIDYRLYPEVDFPVPITDSYDAIKWIAVNYAKLDQHANPSVGFIVGGVSGGGTFASISAHLARDEKVTPTITGLFLICPVLPDGTPDPSNPDELIHRFGDRNRSHEQNKNAPLMNQQMRDGIRFFANFELESPLFSPFYFESHAGIPRTYIQVAGLDPWRDSGIILSEELAKAGVETKLQVYPGVPHCFFTTFNFLSITKKWVQDTVKGMEWLLDKSVLNNKVEKL